MFKKIIVAGLTLAVLVGGSIFTGVGTEVTTGHAWAATSYGSGSSSSSSSSRGTARPSYKASRPQSSSSRSSSSSLASVSVMQVNESTMESKMTNNSRYAVYVGTGAPYTEYWTTASTADDAAKAILSRVRNGYFRTSNARLYNSMMRMGSFSAVKTYPSHGSTVYCFQH